MGSLKDASISKKITIGSLLSILLLTVILGFSSYRSTKENLINETFQRLTAVKEAKSQHIEDYFSYMDSLLKSLANSSTAKDGIREFADAFYRIADETGVDIDSARILLKKDYEKNYLPLVNYSIPGVSPKRETEAYLPRNPNGIVAQYIFILKNPHPVGKKNKLIFNPDFLCTYMEVHKRFHPEFNYLLQQFGLYDIFLIDKKGTIVYTTFKEKEFATNLIKGPYSDTGLAEAFRKAIKSPPGKVVFSDFKPYEPSHNQPAAFIASPIYSKNEVLGVIAFQLPIDKIDSIVNFNYHFKEAGLGKTGELYIAGSDYLLKNNIRLIKEIDDPVVKQAGTTIGILKADTLPVRKALQGESGNCISKNFFGKEVLASYAPINVFGKHWAIVAEIEEHEILSGLFSLRENKLLAFTLIFLLFMVAVFIIFIRKSLVQPLNLLTHTAKDLAEGEGDLTKKLTIDRGDEIGTAAKYFNAFIEKVRQIIERAKKSVQKNVEIASDLKDKAEAVKQKIVQEKAMVNRAAETAESITKPLQEFEKLISSSEKEVESASQKLTLAMDSIRQLQKTVEKTEEEDKESVMALRNLDRETENIKNIIEIIEDIADKTNLLALNASIEAAKAGEAGKGFAVVADEIRKLAEQIQKNTININKLLNEIIHSISETTQKIEKGNYENMEFLHSVSNNVIAEMEEVTSVMNNTREISKNVKERASKLIRQVESMIEDIKEIDTISENNAKSISEMLLKIKELYLEVDELNRIISTFKTRVD